MDIKLSHLREEVPKNPLVSRLVHLCAQSRRADLVTLAWCVKEIGDKRGAALFNELVVAFRTLETAGLGRLVQSAQRARARFQWAVSPQVVEIAMDNPHAVLHESDLLPAAAKLGLRLPVEGPERPGWTRHLLTLRPHEVADILVPDDLSRREAEWLGDFLLRLARGGNDAATPPPATISGPPRATTPGRDSREQQGK